MRPCTRAYLHCNSYNGSPEANPCHFSSARSIAEDTEGSNSDIYKRRTAVQRFDAMMVETAMRSPNAHPKVSTLGVSVEAVKEQLLLLGHIIPDDVIKAFLDEGRLGRAPGSCMHHYLLVTMYASAAEVPREDLLMVNVAAIRYFGCQRRQAILGRDRIGHGHAGNEQPYAMASAHSNLEVNAASAGCAVPGTASDIQSFQDLAITALDRYASTSEQPEAETKGPAPRGEPSHQLQHAAGVEHIASSEGTKQLLGSGSEPWKHESPAAVTAIHASRDSNAAEDMASTANELWRSSYLAGLPVQDAGESAAALEGFDSLSVQFSSLQVRPLLHAQTKMNLLFLESE